MSHVPRQDSKGQSSWLQISLASHQITLLPVPMTFKAYCLQLYHNVFWHQILIIKISNVEALSSEKQLNLMWKPQVLNNNLSCLLIKYVLKKWESVWLCIATLCWFVASKAIYHSENRMELQIWSSPAWTLIKARLIGLHFLIYKIIYFNNKTKTPKHF